MTSGGSDFNGFPENQLTKFRAVSPCSLVLISFGGTASPLNCTTVCIHIICTVKDEMKQGKH